MKSIITIIYICSILFLVSCKDSDDKKTTTVPTKNIAPIANAGLDFNTISGTRVYIDASKSSDADLDTLTYTWVIKSKPLNSNSNIKSKNNSRTSFLADKNGIYILELKVNDTKQDSIVDTLNINVITKNISEIPITIREPANLSNKLPMIIWLHGLTGQKEDFTTYLNELASLGYLAVSIDALQHGARGTETGNEIYNRVANTNNFYNEMWTIEGQTSDDVIKVISYIQANYNVYEKVCMGGYSMGGDISVAVAGVDERVNCVAGVVTDPDWIRPDTVTSKDANESAQQFYNKYNPLTHINNFIANKYITFEMGGVTDTLISENDAYNFKNYAEATNTYNSVIRVNVHNISHGTAKYDTTVWTNVKAWFETYSAKNNH